jgi:hypothetical protein
LKEVLLGTESDNFIQTVGLSGPVDSGKAKKKDKGKVDKVYEPNIFKANIIVSCDVINAIASGMSLKFMDIFLIETYGVSPAMLLSVQVLQNLSTAYLTPWAKQTLNLVWRHGFKKAFGVVLIWAAGCFFMALICIPGMPLPVVVASIVLMNSLFSCTKAYNRARLINALPHDRVANYMVWDSLNKANQGGVTILGAQLVEWGGYYACFVTTLILLCLRLTLYFVPLALKGIRRKEESEVQRSKSMQRSMSGEKEEQLDAEAAVEVQDSSVGIGTEVAPMVPTRPSDRRKTAPAILEAETGRTSGKDEEHFDEHFSDDEDHHNHPGHHGEADSELFPPHHHHDPDPNELLIVDETILDGEGMVDEPHSPILTRRVATLPMQSSP